MEDFIKNSLIFEIEYFAIDCIKIIKIILIDVSF